MTNKLSFDSSYKNCQQDCNEHKNFKRITIDDLILYIKKKKLRITKPRLMIIEILLSSKHSYTINEIISVSTKIGWKMNKTSIYNNLFSLSKIDVIKCTINMATNEPAYEISYNYIPHIHCYIQKTEKQFHLEINCEIHQSIKKYFSNLGYSISEYIIHAKIKKTE